MIEAKARTVGMIASAAAIVLFLYSAFSYRWLENTQSRYGRIGFSLIAFEACERDECKTTSNFTLIDELRKRTSRRDKDQPSGAFAPAGVITMALSLLSILALGAAAVLAWRRMRHRAPVTTIALLAIMAALLAGCLFIAKKPGGYGAVGVGSSFWAFAIACVAGIVGAQLLAKLVKPVDPDMVNLPGE